MRTPLAAAAAIGLLAVTQLAVGPAAGSPRDDGVARALPEVTRSSDWTPVETIDLPFDAEHPQGMARLGDRFFVSSVEILEPTVRCPDPSACGGYDRTPGRGVGHLFVVGADGRLLADVELGEGDMYHPGGIDYDGRWLWVPVAEYRPDSSTIVYRVDPRTLDVREAFRVPDHIGGVVRDRVTGHLHGVSWGSRRLYTWTASGRRLSREANPSHFVDYQDCDYAGGRTMVCGGIAGLTGPDGAPFELGGLALVDLRTNEVLHEVPVQEWSPGGHVVTRNPVALERTRTGLRLYAGPDDEGDGAILVYDLQL